jgi:hypothetical protein
VTDAVSEEFLTAKAKKAKKGKKGKKGKKKEWGLSPSSVRGVRVVRGKSDTLFRRTGKTRQKGTASILSVFNICLKSIGIIYRTK